MRSPVGVLLVSVGTPKAPTASAVRSYLRQFLMDPRVIDLPAWRRALLVYLLILPLRSGRSARAYREIWTEQGSPLLVFGQALAGKLDRELGEGALVELGMRYGEPSIGDALGRLRASGCQRIVVLPLYAQSSPSATGSAVAETYRRAAEGWETPRLSVAAPFFEHPAYLDARAALAAPDIEHERPDHVLFSFHGVPERQIRRSAGSSPCLEREGCCERLGADNRHCYRAQCFAAARGIAERLGLEPARWSVSFQSRLGRSPWISPYTDQVLADLARSGAERVVVVSSFVIDCLETLEELAIREREAFREHGGKELVVVPAPNDDDRWVTALATITRDASPWLGTGGDE